MEEGGGGGGGGGRRSSTVKPPNKGHCGNGPFVLSSEVVPISEVRCILILYHSQNIKLGR